MKKRVIITVLLVLAALAGTVWAAGEPEPEVSYGEAELFQRGSLTGAQTLPGQLALQSNEEDAYQRIYDGLKQQMSEIDLRDLGLTIAQLQDIYERVINDNPELFYATGGYLYYHSGDLVTRVQPNYLDGIPDGAAEQLEQAVEQALERVEPGMSQTEIALALHDYLVEHVAYNWEVATTGSTDDRLVYTTYGALVNGDAVCQGYAESYQLLLKRCGIKSVVVSSKAMNHAWNLVEIDGSWYHVDTTWDDPVPDLPGYCEHENFLRSDAGIASSGTKGHYGWEDTGITVSASEPDGLFRETSNRMYYYEGNYYYLTIQSGKGSLWRADSLTDETPDVVQSNMSFFRYRYLNPEDGKYYSYPVYGVVWHDGMLYYADGEKNLICFDLSGGSSAVLGTIPFEASASADGKYASTHDTIGLYYDDKTGEIVAVSKTRPDTVLATFRTKDYPVSWDRLDKNTTALAGGDRTEENTMQVGLVWAEQGETANLVAAFYDGEDRLVKVQMVPSNDWEQGLNVLELNLEGYEYERVTFFLLSDSGVPYCEKKTA